MISVVIPALNEERNLRVLLPYVSAVLSSARIDFELIVVDDGSEDGTVDVAREYATVISRRERGLGGAIRAGMREAKGDMVVTMDGDRSHDPMWILDMLKAKGDLVVGSRYVMGGRIKNWPLSRLVLSRGANLLARVILEIPVHDMTSNFRLYNRRAMEEALRCDNTDGYEFQLCAVYRVWKASLSITEVPITFIDRRDGESKLKLGTVVDWFMYLMKLALSK